MAEHYHGINVTNVIKHDLAQNGHTILWYASKLLHHFVPERVELILPH